MIMLILCKLLPCNVSKLFSRYHGCIVSTKDLKLGFLAQKYDFLHFWADECSLKRALHAQACTARSSVQNIVTQALYAYGYTYAYWPASCTLTGTLMRTTFWQHAWKTSLWSRVPSGTVFTNHYHFIPSVPKTFNITSIACIPIVQFLYKLHKQHSQIQWTMASEGYMIMLGRNWYLGVWNT